MAILPRFYVYALARPVKRDWKVFYIGKGTKRRVWRHDDEAHSGCECHKCRTIRKVWRDGGEIQRYILLTTDDEQEALDYEREMIALYGRENLVNHTDGGEGPSGHVASAETRAKMSASQKAVQGTSEARERKRRQMMGHAVSDETREKLKEAWKRNPNRKTRLGQKSTPEHRQRIAESNRGQKRTPEQIRKNSESHKGVKLNLSPEALAARSERMKGNKHGVGNPNIWNKGRAWSSEERKRISDTLIEKAPWRGKRHSETTKQKLSEQRKGKPLNAEHRQRLANAWEQRRIRLSHGYTIYSPSGEAFHTHNLSAFAKDHKLPYSALSRAEKAGRPYNGWVVVVLLE